MSKRKKRSAPKSQPIATPQGQVATPPSTPPRQSMRQRLTNYLIITFVLWLLIFGGQLVMSGQWRNVLAALGFGDGLVAPTEAVGENPAGVTSVQGADRCRTPPQFVRDLSYGPNAMLGTSAPNFVGLALYDPGTASSPASGYQDPTWDDAGYLGPYVIDGEGNIFVAPVPLASLELNPPEEQNKIYRVDTTSGAMQFWLDLPTVQPVSEFNPYGVVGMGIDCFTNSLYVATVAGSTPTQEIGRIYRIAIESGEVVDQLEDVDAMGVGVATLPNGERRLYYGLARTSEVRSLRLAINGDFDGDIRTEFALATLQGGQNERAQRITFDSDGVMLVKGLEFNYSLQATGQVAIGTYRLQYVEAGEGEAGEGVEGQSAETESGTWQLLDIQRETREAPVR